MNYLIYPMKTQPIIFKSYPQLTNFVKYLFSISKNHPATNQTRYNTFIEHSKPDTLIFNTKPETSFKVFNAKNKKHLNKDKIKADLTYLFFVIETKNKIITNFFDMRKEKWNIIIDFTVPENIIEILEVAINKTRSQIKSDIFKFVFHKLTTKKLYSYENKNELKLNEIKYIERTLHNYVNKNYNKTIISISHNDQDLYHIHRIIKDNF